LKTATNNDIAVGMGSDAAVPFVPHYEFWRELVYYQHFAEISNKRAIHIATELNAILLGIEEITSTVEVGKFANFIVLDTIPLDDLMVLENPRHVVIRGNMIENPGYEKIKTIEAHKANRYFEKYISKKS
jgi:imidazolonepropionase-like amidohydrolase